MRKDEARKIAHKIQLVEGLEMHDLKNLVSNVISIDSFTSKMGNEEDVCVLCFVIKDKDPALDLVNFIEKGYNFVLDADCTPGENSNGEYYVFVELERSVSIPEQVIELIGDVVRLTDIPTNEWKFSYYKSNKEFPLTDAAIRQHVILTPEEYLKTIEIENIKDEKEINSLKQAAGIEGKGKKKSKDKDIESLQAAAGII